MTRFFDSARMPDYSLHVYGDQTLVDHQNRRWAIQTHYLAEVLGLRHTPITPIQAGIVAHGFRDTVELIFFHQPAAIRPIHLALPTTRSFDIQWPDLLFALKRKIHGSFLFDLRVFAFRDLLNPETPLLIPPLHNLDAHGSMCFGSILHQEISSPARFVEQIFFKTLFTHPGFVSPKIKTSVTEYLTHHRKSGWNFDDLALHGSFQELLNEEGSP